MHIITHLLISLFISIILSLRYNVNSFGFLLGTLSGTLLDLDHLYYYVKYHGYPKSVMDVIQTMFKAYKQPPDSGIRYHTALHELVGLFLFLTISMLMVYFCSLVYALLLFLPILGHFLADALSIRMMLFSPFSKREFFIGLLKPNSTQEKIVIVLLCDAIVLLAIFSML